MKARQTRRELEILRRMAEIEADPDELGKLMREGDSWWIDTERCTRTARMLLLKGLIQEGDPSDDQSYATLSNWGRMALTDADFVSPFAYVSLGIEPPPAAKLLMDPTRYSPRSR